MADSVADSIAGSPRELRHPLDTGPLTMGLLMLTLAALYLVDHAGWVTVDPVVGVAACWVVVATVFLARSAYRLVARH